MTYQNRCNCIAERKEHTLRVVGVGQNTTLRVAEKYAPKYHKKSFDLVL